MAVISPPARTFTRSFTAEAEHIDELGHVNNAVWVQWIQSVATSHWAAVARLADQGAYVWVITRHEIDYLRPLLAGASVIAHTWVGDAARGATFDRHMLFLGSDGRAYVSATTTWALLDRVSGRPVRVRPEMIAQFQQ